MFLLLECKGGGTEVLVEVALMFCQPTEPSMCENGPAPRKRPQYGSPVEHVEE